MITEQEKSVGNCTCVTKKGVRHCRLKAWREERERGYFKPEDVDEYIKVLEKMCRNEV